MEESLLQSAVHALRHNKNVRPLRTLMLTPLENAVLEMMLDRPGEPYTTLRQHLAHATVDRRESTGVGFAIYFRIPSDAPIRRDLPETTIYDVGADIRGLTRGASFKLFVREGVLAFLEGVTATGDWPEDTNDFRVYRFDPV